MNDRLLEMGIYNTASEIFQAHYMNQVIRLARTKGGRSTLEALDINPPTQVATKRSLPPEWQQEVITRPFPTNMHTRPPRAKAYDKYSDQAGAFFVDAAGPLHNCSTETVVHRGQAVNCISANEIDITAMEEAGIALAMRNPRATFVLTDSQTAHRNFARGQVGRLEHSILQQAAANRQEGQWKQLLWAPGHAGVEAMRLLMPPPENFYTRTPPIPPQYNFSPTRTIPSPSFHILRSCNTSGLVDALYPRLIPN
ncbi:hypothetical protein HPB49_013670 [Dermacentor silvarum]|uniref:Uncharacterized protein n=1 Tax=Dermacentor silvarum TaxID=543639 RepID=A0ACB8E0K8_DERSI|nr:hypothetical protein HPB49_013670 [Dermacentor silvarum]